MYTIALIMGLLAVVAALIQLADKIAIPYPILLVIGGLLLGFIPNQILPDVVLEPDIVLLVFLPPLLYWDALHMSWRDFRASIRPIISLAFGLVVLTTVGVAVVGHAVLGLPWSVSFVLGAVISSTDALAAGSIMEHLGVPHQTVTILEGESLINDATALVVYASAVGVVVQGSFSLVSAGLQFVMASLGGIAAGLLVGWLVIGLRRQINNPQVEGMLALLTPFAAYLPADLLGASGVLGAVVAGLYVGRKSPGAIAPATRLQADAIWELGTFVINGLTFILIGLQLHPIVLALSGISFPTLLIDTAVVSAAVIVLRIGWVFPGAYIGYARGRLANSEERPPSTSQMAIVAWAGLRGVVALATALALPEHVGNGPFPDRNLILFLTFGVIFVTLVGQGLTLSSLIRWLGVVADDTAEREETQARLAVAHAALQRLDLLAENENIPRDLLEDLRMHYQQRVAGLEARPKEGGGSQQRTATRKVVQREILSAERATLVALRDSEVIGDDALRRVQRDLDLDEIRLR